MRKVNDRMLRPSTPRGLPARGLRPAAWVVILVLPWLISSTAYSQSGRRASRTLPTTNSTETVAPEKETKAATATELARKVSILIGRETSSKHLASEDAITASFVKRLNEFPSLSVTATGNLKRSAAVKRAQAESEAFVVLLQFDIDSFQSGTILINSQDLEVKYFVFAPRTGKEQSKGKVYYQTIGGGRLRKSDWPNGTPIKITTEAAGVEAAEQLHAWLAVVVGVKQKT